MKRSASFPLAAFVSVFFLLSSATLLQAKILVVSPHPDDDVIISSGIVSKAVARGEPVHVVYMTNGDATGAPSGYQRQDEAVAGQGILGVPENSLIFLGYPDGYLSTIYSSFVDQGTQFVSPNGISATYGERGLGHSDYHTYRFGVAANYNRANILTDLQDILATFLPDHILVTSEFDVHPDHSTTYLLVKLAVAAVNSGNPAYTPTIHKTIEHWNDGAWPPPIDPTSYFSAIPNLTPDTGLAWSARESLDVPVSMQSNTYVTNPKCQAIAAHASQGGIGSLGAFIHKDEFFFVENVAGANQPPTVNAGPGQTVLQGHTVQLDGTQSTSPGGATLSYQWVQRAGPPVVLSQATSATPTFVAPSGLLEDTPLSFDLVVSDGKFTSLPDSAGIQVTGTFTVTPATELSAIGAPGGPFSPSGAAYTLQNSGSSALTWSASKTQPWVTLSANAGSLAPGATATVMVSLNATAGTLVVGSYSDTVTFTYTANGSANTTRAVNLAVTTVQASNIAPLATVTASSENTTTGQTAVKAVDGVIDGYPGDYTKEWATTGQGVGAFLNLAWSSPYSVDQVVLYDRPNLDDSITGATLTFSDGSSIVVGPLNNNGAATTYSFPARVITGVKMTVTGVSSTTANAGLSEIQVYGIPAGGTQYTLTTGVTPPGAGSATANPSLPVYPSGTKVVLTAAPSAGYSFSGWSGGASGTANPLTVTMAGDLSLTANFTPLPGTLAVTPATALSATGTPGGPFTPSSSTYTLQNSGSSDITWSASNTQTWVTLSATGGSLAPGATATLTVTLNSIAATLAVGSYSDTVTFTNVTNGSGNTARAVNLTVTTVQSANIAPLATVTASTQNAATGQTAVKAVDGVIDGYPGDYTREWATTGQGVGSWLNLSWSSPYSVNKVVLYDRPNLNDNITSATLAFSDGSSIVVGPLNNDGTATTYSFSARVITGLKLTVTGVSSTTGSVGLSELQVYGIPSSGTQYTLTNSVTPSGGGSVAANPSQPVYPSGTQVILTATPSTGYVFSGWSGGASGTVNPLTVTISGNLSITATFAPLSGTLSVTPATALSATGAPGGPFTPSSSTYTLQNPGNSAITWSASNTQPWVTLSLNGGSLAPGATATIAVSLNAAAATLALGSYSDTVTFTNVTNGSGNTTRGVNLTVAAVQASNIAPLATVTASSQNTATGQTAVKAVDGVIDGYPGDYTREWATAGQGFGAWLNLSWSSPYQVNQVVLYDRPNLDDNITSATLDFSDGSSIVVGPLNNNGTATTYSFPARVISGLKLTVSAVSSSTGSVGLSEIQVYGTPVSATQYTLTPSVTPSGAGSVTVSPTQPGYFSGTQVILTATPSTGYSFSSWSGGASGTANPLTVTITGNLSLTANFTALPGTLAVTPAAALSATGAPGGPFTPVSSAYTLQNTGNSAITWSAAKTQPWVTLSLGSGSLASGTTATVAVSFNTSAAGLALGSYSDTVTFANTTNGSGNTTRAVNLTIAAAQPTNIAPLATVTASTQNTTTGQTAAKAVDGVIDGYPGDYTREWASTGPGVGAWLNLSWSSPYSVSQVVLYDRPNLDDNITSATLAFSDGSSLVVGPLNNNGTATTYSFPARVITGLKMTVTGVSSSTGSVGLSEIQVYGIPTSGTQYTLTTSVTPSGAGSVTANPSQSGYPNGTQVILTATPNSGYTFSSWSGGASGTANPLTITVNGTTAITAVFTASSYTLSYSAGANGTISGVTPQTVSSGGSGTLVTAVANSGYHFVSWSDGVTTAARTDTKVTANITVTANFALGSLALNYSIGADGIISGLSAQVVSSGGIETQVTPAAGTIVLVILGIAAIIVICAFVFLRDSEPK